MDFNLSEQIEMNVADAGVCEKKIAFSVNADGLAKTAGLVLRDLAASVTLPGFRKGKAPVAMLNKRYAREIDDEIRRSVYQAGFQKLEAEKLDIVTWGRPEDGEYDRAKGFSFTITVGVAPEFEPGEYTGIKVSVPAAAVDPKVVEERLAGYRKMYADFVDADTPAQAEDMLKVAYESDFQIPENASPAVERMVKSDNNYIWLAEPESIPGSIKGLTGVNAGEKREFTAEYPADFRIAELAGKSVKYIVTVNAVQRRRELDDAALAEKLKISGIDELKADIEKMVRRDADAKRDAEIREAVYAKLDAATPQFDLPAGLVESEIAGELRNLAERTVKNDADAEKFKAELEQHRAEADKAARERLRRMFIFRKIAAKESITVDEAQVAARLEAMAAYYGKKASELRKIMEGNGGLDTMRLEMLDEKVWRFLADKAEVSE